MRTGRRNGEAESFATPILHPPAPELVDGGEWQINDSGVRGQPKVIFGDPMKIYAPFGATPTARALRAHEQAHIAITPRDVGPNVLQQLSPDLGPHLLNAAEDARVNRYANERISQVMYGGTMFSEDDANRVVNSLAIAGKENGDYRLLGGLVAASTNTADASRIDAAIRECDELDGSMRAALERVRYSAIDLETFEDTIGLARALETLRRAQGTGEPDPDGVPELAEMAEEYMGTDPSGESSVPKWGELNVIRPPLTEPLVATAAARRVRTTAATTGTRLGNIRRLAPVGDGRVLTRRRYRLEPGGIVLLDWSGSMSLDTDDVQAVLKASPTATMAYYSGRNRDGTLVVMAANGRTLADPEAFKVGMGNIVDGPALRWAIETADPNEPIIWVCDGIVTGVDDCPHPALTAECVALCREHRIVRVETVEEALDYLPTIGRR